MPSLSMEFQKVAASISEAYSGDEKGHVMAEKALHLYQGGDWLTYRWSAAQVFDTLDRVRELCGHVPLKMSIPPETRVVVPDYELGEESRLTDIFACMIELCDDLAGELDTALADLFSFLHNPTLQRWMGFEMQLHLQSIRQQAMAEHQAEEPSPTVIDTIMALANRMRDLLKQIDQ